MSDIRQLLPCPFCGAEPRLITEDRRMPSDPERFFYEVACRCSAQTGVSRDRGQAVEMWNRRSSALATYGDTIARLASLVGAPIAGLSVEEGYARVLAKVEARLNEAGARIYELESAADRGSTLEDDYIGILEFHDFWVCYACQEENRVEDGDPGSYWKPSTALRFDGATEDGDPVSLCEECERKLTADTRQASTEKP